ncbi:TPA: hypothetical protein J0399_003077 [Enterococcus faecalis]|uniref:RadC-like JAB domain-containing protein n=1 Tax=Mammaliicoccus sciuri TaxID=1296 RepID=A0AB37HXZ1_MAMSC|nr:hypothetical protein [Enterococcus faecalis]QRN92774.1 hypothetical protein JRU67_14835 [Mammaliicoccus sciuri]RXY94783.1 hypothetical protein DD607_04925 [Salmonella sp. 3DZ2-4SM]EKS9964082.1 hypothetical protein [Enterococcus faecalis]MBX9006129.1 hypothetical protein [Enterococcus faecalis]
MEVTRNIKKISKMIGIDLLDHIIIGNGEFRSLEELNLI